MASGAQTGNVDLSSLDKDAWLCSWLPGVDVTGARGGSWSLLCFTWLYLTTKPLHMGADVDGLAGFLHHPMVCD
jgi:hypothetical protein